MIKNHKIKSVIVTGGCGFIGSHFIEECCARFPNIELINIDNLSYAASKKTELLLSKHKNYHHYNIDISNTTQVKNFFNSRSIDLIVHFAAESHVDNSITNPINFLQTNLIGTYNLLDCIVKSSNVLSKKPLFHHISTDEVYGDLAIDDDPFSEDSQISPSSPYSASKASSDHLVEAWSRTFGIKSLITNCSNNFGPRQFTEKLIPKVILNALNLKKIPIYGSGKNIRDWLYVKDHINAIFALYEHDVFGSGERFNIGGGFEVSNIEIVSSILSILSKKYHLKEANSLIQNVEDRLGHDFRYAINNSKICSTTSWKPSSNFKEDLDQTISWYIENSNWWE